jgi:hypothetical protein
MKRRPLTEWEAEQERIKAEEAMNAMHAEALEMNIVRSELAQVRSRPRNGSADEQGFDRDREEQRRLAEQAQREHEERIKRKRQNKPAAMPKRSTKRRLKPRAVKLKRKQSEKRAAEAERLAKSRQKRNAWQKRSASPMSRQSVKLT